MTEKKVFQIQNTITKYVFKLTKEECDNIMLNDPHNFRVLDKDYTPPFPEEAKSKTIFEKVIGEENEETTVNYEEKTVAELKAYAAEKGYDLGTATRKADIIAKIKELEAGE